MQTRTVTERIGENMGPIDWAYDFRPHFNNLCTNDAGRDEACERSKARLREIDEAFASGKAVEATSYGGWPRCGWGRVIDVGMYDGWPYWRPIPSVCITTFLGAEWIQFPHITDLQYPNEPTP